MVGHEPLLPNRRTDGRLVRQTDMMEDVTDMSNIVLTGQRPTARWERSTHPHLWTCLKVVRSKEVMMQRRVMFGILIGIVVKVFAPQWIRNSPFLKWSLIQ
jgi:hypothetical protein